MNNKFEGWVLSDFKYLWSENVFELRYVVVLKIIIVIDYLFVLVKVYVFWWE